MSAAHAQSIEPIDVRPLGEAATEVSSPQAGGEIVVQSLEGEVAITVSTKTQNLHAGELLYLSAGEPHSVKGAEPASLLLSIQDPESKQSEENETLHARGVVLSVMQVLFMGIALTLLLVVAAGNLLAGSLVVAVALVIAGFLHYWVWGRWMSSALRHPSRKQPQ